MNRVEVMLAAGRLHTITDMDEAQEVREQIKAAVHEWSQDLIVETLLDGAWAASRPINEDHEKVLTYGLAYLHTDNCKQALRNGMTENLPPSDVLTPNEITLAIDEMTELNRDLFDRWGLGHTLTRQHD